MRLAALLVTMLTFAATPGYAQAQGFGRTVDRQARVQFNAMLPPGCVSGWYGRGIGIVAICSLGWRANVRFIDGYVLPCAVYDCRDHAARIDYFLRLYGF